MNFKKFVIAGTIGCAAISFSLIFAACGDDSSSSANDGDETAEDFIKANSGTVQTVLIEEWADGYATGYTGNYIKVYIHDPERRLEAGEFVKAATEDAFMDGAIACLAK